MRKDGVTLNEKHCYEDFGLIMQSVEIGYPEPKTEIVDIFGMDGNMDLTEALGNKVFYGNREIRLSFVLPKGSKDWIQSASNLANHIHGRNTKLILDAEKYFYYEGRARVEPFKSDLPSPIIEVNIDAKPYKKNAVETWKLWEWDPFNFQTGLIIEGEISVSGSRTIRLQNFKKEAVPEFKASTSLTIEYNGNSYPLQKGVNKIKEIKLSEGENILIVNGYGNIQITYEVGKL